MFTALLIFTFSIVTLFIGVSSVFDKASRNTNNKYFFAYCTSMAVRFLIQSIILISVRLNGAKYAWEYYDGMLNTSVILLFFNGLAMLAAMIFMISYFRSLTKVKSPKIELVQKMICVVAVIYTVTFIGMNIYEDINPGKYYQLFSFIANAMSSLLTASVFITTAYVLVYWRRNAKLRRELHQANTFLWLMVFGILISSVDILGISAKHYLGIMTFVSIFEFVKILVMFNFAHRFSDMSFTVANMSEHLYKTVKMPVLTLDETGKVVLCNAYSEGFFKTRAQKLYGMTLFELFDFRGELDELKREKQTSTIFNYNASCTLNDTHCLISLNYVYDRYEEIICALAVVSDVTEKESLIAQLNESKREIEMYNSRLEAEVARQTESIRNLQQAIIHSISDLIEKKDNYTGGHTERVSTYVGIMLRHMLEKGYPISESDISRISESSLLHDMGKIAIPDNILLKNGRLTQDEFEVMKKHSSIGAESLSNSMRLVQDDSFLTTAYEMAAFHHEKWNGDGYPDGRQGEDIPFVARVASIADVYDALRSERPYKEPFSREKARGIIEEDRGRQFDPELVDVFLAVESQFDAFCESTRVKHAEA